MSDLDIHHNLNICLNIDLNCNMYLTLPNVDIENDLHLKHDLNLFHNLDFILILALTLIRTQTFIYDS